MLVLAVQNSRISHKIKKMIKLSIEFRNSEAHCFFGHPQAARINRRLRCNSNLTFAHVPSIIQLKLLLCLYWCENRYWSWYNDSKFDLVKVCDSKSFDPMKIFFPGIYSCEGFTLVVNQLGWSHLL